MKRRFFICSVGRPGDGYDEENLNRCIDNNGHFMHRNTQHKGLFDEVSNNDVTILKYNDKLVAYGLVNRTDSSDNVELKDWNYAIYVDRWFFFDEQQKEKGVNRNGVQDAVINGDQYATIKEIKPEFALKKIEEINKGTELFKTLKQEFEMGANVKDICNLLEANQNLILTGAPGTGKTYLAKQMAKEIITQKEVVKPFDILKSAIDNFKHVESNDNQLIKDFQDRFPIGNLKKMTLDDYCIGRGDGSKDSFCYWIERKLKPLGYYSPRSSESYLLYWSKSDEEYKVHGYLKEQNAKEPESLMKKLAEDIYNLVTTKDTKTYSKQFGDSFILKVLNSYYPNEYFPINSRTHLKNVISLFDIDCNSEDSFERNKAVLSFYKEKCGEKNISPFEFMHILYNNFNIKEGEIKEQNGEIVANGEYQLIQFHPSYDYTDFVEGLRPVREEGQKEIGFVRQDGVFKKLCAQALKNPNKKYVMIIDEINRGEISKVFGELFFSIDSGYRGVKGKVQTQYQNLVEEDDEFYDGFYVPKNVYIIGTMNDIDRSVESMDFAFRRRFAFKEITAEESQKMLENDEAWGKDENGKSLKPDDKTIGTIKEKMDNLNKAIWHKPTGGESDGDKSIEGLSSAYHIGASYFLKLKNYQNNDGSFDFDKLWEYHLEGLLFEYLRGTTELPKKLKRLAEAYGYTKVSKYE